MSDNSTVIANTNKQGGTQYTTCKQLTKDIWIICMDKGTHVSAAHIPGKQNILADTASRKFHDVSEWMLSKNIFNHLIAYFGMSEIELLHLDSISNCIDILPGFLIQMLYIEIKCL